MQQLQQLQQKSNSQAAPTPEMVLPTQLDSIRRVTEFPSERHRWNTNEEVAALLLSFDHHSEWERKDVHLRPPSGTMLLYNKNKARYRKDGYCWKKRRDGKTTREDHMKLKVNGVECIYGCYVHSAILPTFHRRCYWLLQNPDLVLVHYLNVPMTDDNKLCLPSLTLQLGSREMTRDSLISQLTPMFASLKHLDAAKNIENAEEFIESLAQHLMMNSGGAKSADSHLQMEMGGLLRVANCSADNNNTSGTQQSSSKAAAATATSQNTMHSRLLDLIVRCKAAAGENSPIGSPAAQLISTASATTVGHLTLTPVVMTMPPTISQQPNNVRTMAPAMPGRFILPNHTCIPGMSPMTIMSTPTGARLVGIRPMSAPTLPLNISLVPPPLPLPPQQPRLAPAPTISSNELMESHRQPVVNTASPSMLSLSSPPNVWENMVATAANLQQSLSNIVIMNQSNNNIVVATSAINNEGFRLMDTATDSRDSSEATSDFIRSVEIDGLLQENDLLSEKHSYPFLPDMSANLYPNGRTESAAHLASTGLELKPIVNSGSNTDRLLGQVFLNTDGATIHQTNQQNNGQRQMISQAADLQLLQQQQILKQHQQNLQQQQQQQSQRQSQQHVMLSNVHSHSNDPVSNSSIDDSFHHTLLENDLRMNYDHLRGLFSITPDDGLPSTVTGDGEPSRQMSPMIITTDPTFEGGCPLSGETSMSPGGYSPGSDFDAHFHSEDNDLAANFESMLNKSIVAEESSGVGEVGMGSSETSLLKVCPEENGHQTGLSQESVTLSPGCDSVTQAAALCEDSESCGAESLDRKITPAVDESTALADITDFCPEWSYTEGGAKVLITGCWSDVDCEYSVKFGDQKVSAVMIQPGVLRCYAPPHKASEVSLRVECGGEAVTAEQSFEYRLKQDRPSSAESSSSRTFAISTIRESDLIKSLIEKFFSLEKNLIVCEPEYKITIQLTELAGVSEQTFLDIINKWSEQDLWNDSAIAYHSADHQLSLLHLAGGLGYRHLIDSLIQCSVEKCSALISDLDPLSVDFFGCTPLMWACQRGHVESAVSICELNPAALHITDHTGLTPVDVLKKTTGRAALSLINYFNSVQSSKGDTIQQAIYNTSTTSSVVSSGKDFICESVNETDRASVEDSSKLHKDKSLESTETSDKGFRVPGAVLSLGSPQTGQDLAFEAANFLAKLPPKGRRGCKQPPEKLSFRSLSMESDTLSKNFNREYSPVSLKDGGGGNSSRKLSAAGSNSQSAGTAFQQSDRTPIRLLKRTSVDILPDCRFLPPFKTSDSAKLWKAKESIAAASGETQQGGEGASGEATSSKHHDILADFHGTAVEAQRRLNMSRISERALKTSEGDPMISQCDRDINSPIMFLQHGSCGSSFDSSSTERSISFDDVLREATCMELDQSSQLDRDVDGLLASDSLLLQGMSEGDFAQHSTQMMTLANQIIAAMPERIKLSPNHSSHLLVDEINDRRSRSSSFYGSFSSTSATPPGSSNFSATALSNAPEDSGISTPREGLSFLEYRYSDLGTPSPSTLSPSSTCVQSPFSFGIDSPPPTAEEFTEYFNAPATYMEKDFSQLTLSDEEQRRLYEAAKIIQSFYRKYKDRMDCQQKQQQKEIEAAILIQSYYRRYKQFMYYKRMTQAAVLIQSQFRTYYAQKRFRRSREAATIIQNRYRAYKQHERYKKSRSAAVLIQQRFRSHYQRVHGKQTSLVNSVHKMMTHSDLNRLVNGRQRKITSRLPDK